MIQQMQHVCPECRGAGEVISDKDKCPQCKGNKVVQEKKVLEVHVEKGMQHGQKIVFQGEADEAPDTVAGDIVFVLQLKEHPKFKRKFDDLYVEHTLSLTEALCGFQFALTHLDGRQLLIKSNPGEVIKPDQHKAINDEGMPQHGRPFMKAVSTSNSMLNFQTQEHFLLINLEPWRRFCRLDPAPTCQTWNSMSVRRPLCTTSISKRR